MLLSFFQLVGIIFSSYVIFEISKLIIKIIQLYVLPLVSANLDPKKYGQWSVITGATSGIGKSFAEQIAKLGGNVVIIGRRKDTLEEIKEDFEKKYKVMVRTVVKDFSILSDYDQLEKSLSDLDIGILVNNVGMAHEKVEEFQKIDPKSLSDLINTNMASYCLMTRMVIPQMIKKKKGIIVNIASATAYAPLRYFGIYPSSKRFLNHFTECLQLEHPFEKYGIYINCINPFYISTKMTKIRPSFFIPSADVYVKSAINSFEYGDESNGCLPHQLQTILLRLLPSFLVRYGILSFTGSLKRKFESRSKKSN